MPQAAEASGVRPRRSGRPRPASASGRPGACSTSPTTTSSAPPSPATTRRRAGLPHAIYDNGDIELGTYEGLYCVSCEAYYTEAELVDGTVPDPPPPGRGDAGGELLLQAQPLPAAAARLVRGQPRRRAARDQAQRGARAHPPGLQDISITRTSFDWGVPVPWDDAPRLLRLVRRAHQLRHRRRLRQRRRALRHVVAGRAPPHRQGHPPVPLRVLAGDAAWRPGIEPPRQRLRARLAAGGRREDEQDAGSTRSRPPTWSPTSASTASATTSSATPPFGPDGDFSYEGMVARYNTDLANNLGNLLTRVATVVGRKCGGIGPAPRPDSPLAPVAAEVVRGHGRRRGTRFAPSRRRSRRRGGSSARPTPTSRPTSRGRPSPGRRSTPCWATPSRCCASSPSWPARPCPRPAPRCGAASASTGSPVRRPPARGGGVGRLPGRAAGGEGRAAVPPHQAPA